jgi:hypothetical protein
MVACTVLAAGLGAVGPRWLLRSAEFTTSWLTFAPSAGLLEQGLNRLAAGLV